MGSWGHTEKHSLVGKWSADSQTETCFDIPFLPSHDWLQWRDSPRKRVHRGTPVIGDEIHCFPSPVLLPSLSVFLAHSWQLPVNIAWFIGPRRQVHPVDIGPRGKKNCDDSRHDSPRSTSTIACLGKKWLGEPIRPTRKKKRKDKKRDEIRPQRHPVYARRVDPSALACSLSSHRKSHISLVFGFRFVD